MNHALSSRDASPPEISTRTQAVLLLTSHFSRQTSGGPRPLTAGEWWRFALWMKQNQLLPETLLDREDPGLLSGFRDRTITPDRLRLLLDRGAALGFASEKWHRAGLFVLTQWDADYPPRLKQRLRADSPPILFGCGERRLLCRGGVAIIGSRGASEEELSFTRDLGTRVAQQGVAVISGAARGVDETAMLAAIEAGGTVVGVLPDSLLRAATGSKYRHGLTSGGAVLVSPYHPEAGFDVGNAMGRNKYIYCLADAAVAVTAGNGTGGTWKGAVENLENRWVPLWVRLPSAVQTGQSGNGALLSRGARALPEAPTIADLVAAQDEPATPSLFAAEFESRDVPVPDPGTSSSVAGEPVSSTVVPPSAEASFYDHFLYRFRQAAAATPVTPEQLSEQFELEVGQLKAWLVRAVADGVAERLSRPIRYAYRPNHSAKGPFPNSRGK